MLASKPSSAVLINYSDLILQPDTFIALFNKEELMGDVPVLLVLH